MTRYQATPLDALETLSGMLWSHETRAPWVPHPIETNALTEIHVDQDCTQLPTTTPPCHCSRGGSARFCDGPH